MDKKQQHQQSSECWVFRDVPSDIVIEVDADIFALHKFPLVSRSGRIRKLVAERRDSNTISMTGVPGGARSFELAAKFCYGINFEITHSNVAQLLCVSHYLDMSEDYSKNSLKSRSEEYLDTIACKNLEMCVQVLRSCESLLPFAEELGVVSRCVNGIASKACVEQIASSFSRLEYSSSGRLHMSKQMVKSQDWWIEDLSSLRVDFYERVILAIKCRGVRPESIGSSLVHYAERELMVKKPSTTRPVVETVVRLLPVEKGAVPVAFLFGMLRSVVAFGCSASCRTDLERRIGSQLENATLDDLLIPNNYFGMDGQDRDRETLFDVESVRRVLENFSQMDGDSEGDDDHRSVMFDDDVTMSSPSQSALFKVSKLIDSYLAEIAPDSNLELDLFIAVIEALPGHARNVHDGLYRAIDIYLKAHHEAMSESDKRRLCKVIDFQKLSHEAGEHAAQNELLPIQSVVQVLYYEQLKLRNSLFCSSSYEEDDDQPIISNDRWRANSGARSAVMSPRDNYASLRRENRDLKLELARMRMRLNDLERDHVHMKRNLRRPGSSKLMRSLSKKMNVFSRTWSRRSSSSSKESNGNESMLTERDRM